MEKDFMGLNSKDSVIIFKEEAFERCKESDNFDEFCSRASELAAESNGEPLFTVTQTRNSPKMSSSRAQQADSFDVPDDDAEGSAQDDWQLL